MSYTTLISSEELARSIEHPNWVIVDTRFSLNDPERGRRDYQQAHIPGAVYAHLDEDLSGPIIPGQTGRHPLPSVEALSHTLSQWGVGPGVQVVAYDDHNGSIAARLWWMLRWLGHETVAVLDGGWAKWQSESRPVTQMVEARHPKAFIPQLRPELVVDATWLLAVHNDPLYWIIDSRTIDRYAGTYEPLDPVAGHIPGASVSPYQENFDQQACFLSPEALREHFQKLLGDAPPEHVIFYCGSGVTAAHNILAFAHAGLGDARLYAGSWSEWITDPSRPVAQGAPER